jgi:thiamine-monophosphate kinase
MLVEGTHFLADTDPEDLGWKTLAVNVSDIAAMGARPRWATLAAALPAPMKRGSPPSPAASSPAPTNSASTSIGGDTTRGPRNFCVTIFGEVESAGALRRERRQGRRRSGFPAGPGARRWGWPTCRAARC